MCGRKVGYQLVYEHARMCDFVTGGNGSPVGAGVVFSASAGAGSEPETPKNGASSAGIFTTVKMKMECSSCGGIHY